MTVIGCYHAGVLVADLDRAIDRFSTTLGVSPDGRLRTPPSPITRSVLSSYPASSSAAMASRIASTVHVHRGLIGTPYDRRMPSTEGKSQVGLPWTGRPRR